MNTSSSAEKTDARTLSADYFVNHAVARKWPFTIYHGAIENSLACVLQRVLHRNSDPHVLVFGCGLFH